MGADPGIWTLLDQLTSDKRVFIFLVVSCILLAIGNIAWDRIN